MSALEVAAKAYALGAVLMLWINFVTLSFWTRDERGWELPENVQKKKALRRLSYTMLWPIWLILLVVWIFYTSAEEVWKYLNHKGDA